MTDYPTQLSLDVKLSGWQSLTIQKNKNKNCALYAVEEYFKPEAKLWWITGLQVF